MFVDYSRKRNPYFLDLQRALKEARIAWPVLVVDKNRLEKNLAQVQSQVSEDMRLRVVAKSLPCLPLLDLITKCLNTRHLMTFNHQMLLELAEHYPDHSQLLGKPLPVEAAEKFYQEAGNNTADIYWLIDTRQRLEEYGQLAGKISKHLNIVLEIDVGLHRGGFSVGGELRNALEHLKASNTLSFAGFMGYEAHLVKVPTLFGMRQRQIQKVKSTFTEANALAAGILGEDVVHSSIRNTGGSGTFMHYAETDFASEVSLGSVFMKPTDFDYDVLQHISSSLFISAPVLKVLDGTQTPVLEKLDRLKRFFNPNLANTLFIHGGYWKADPVDPPGLRTNPTFGNSTNQQMLNIGTHSELKADDFIFFRPTQSEAVMMQFGEIAVFDGERITDYWQPMRASA